MGHGFAHLPRGQTLTGAVPQRRGPAAFLTDSLTIIVLPPGRVWGASAFRGHERILLWEGCPRPGLSTQSPHLCFVVSWAPCGGWPPAHGVGCPPSSSQGPRGLPRPAGRLSARLSLVVAEGLSSPHCVLQQLSTWCTEGETQISDVDTSCTCDSDTSDTAGHSTFVLQLVRLRVHVVCFQEGVLSTRSLPGRCLLGRGRSPSSCKLTCAVTNWAFPRWPFGETTEVGLDQEHD